MAFTYNSATDLGYVRLQIADTVDDANLVFQDAEIQAFLDRNDQNVWLACGAAYRSIAASRARMARALKVLDVDIDTKLVSKEFLALAESMEAREDNSGAFDIVEMVEGNFARHEANIKRRMRQGCGL